MKLPLIAALMLSMCIPLAAAIAVVATDRKRDPRLKRKLPIGSKVLNGPGDSLRARLEVINEDVDSKLVGLALVGPMTAATWALLRVDWSTVRLGAIEIIFLVAAAGATGGLIRSLIKAIQLRRRFREGLLAERFTAQELNRLTAMGCAVFHDVPAEAFNLDHVVVGNGAVFAVETKSRRKAAGPDGHRVRFDGERLRFPDHVSTKPLEQADRNARWLARKLATTLGRPVPVIPVVALPGWYVEYTREAAKSAVRVMPVGGKSSSFMVDAGRPMDTGFRSMVGQAISMLYPSKELGEVA